MLICPYKLLVNMWLVFQPLHWDWDRCALVMMMWDSFLGQHRVLGLPIAPPWVPINPHADQAQGCQRLLTGRVHICFQWPRFPQPWHTPFEAGQTRRLACGVRPDQRKVEVLDGHGGRPLTRRLKWCGVFDLSICRSYLVGGVLEVVSWAEPSLKVTNFRNYLCKRQCW